MEIIIVCIPLFTSIIALYFYYLVKPITKALRFIPYVLISIIIEDFYWLCVYINIIKTTSDNANMPPFSILSMLFLFLFVYELLEKKTMDKSHILIHFLPVTFLTAIYLTTITDFASWSLDSKTYYWVSYICGVILGLIYLIILSFKIHRIKSDNHKTQGTIEIIVLPIVIIVLVSMSIVITIVFGAFFNLTFYLFKVIQFITILLLYFYLFSMYKEKLEIQGEQRIKSFETLYNIPKVITKKDEKLSTVTKQHYIENSFSAPTMQKYQKSLLSVRKIKEYEKVITHFFIHEEDEYLNVDFNMQKLSLLTGIPGYYLSQVFNIGLKTNFNAYLSDKRIEFACKLLEEHKNRISVTELCFLCGYKSRTSFYEQFEKVTGHSLTEYKRLNRFSTLESARETQDRNLA